MEGGAPIKTILVTGVNRDFFAQAAIWFQSCHENLRDTPFYVCDFGLTSRQRQFFRERGVLLERPTEYSDKTHPWLLKASLLDFVGQRPFELVVWADADMIVMPDFEKEMAAVGWQLRHDNLPVAVCTDAHGWSIADFIKLWTARGRSTAWLAERVNSGAIDANAPYLNAGFFAARSREAIRRYQQESFEAPNAFLFEQNALHSVLYGHERGFVMLRPEQWNVHGPLLDHVKVRNQGGPWPKVTCRGQGVCTLHATSSDSNHFVYLHKLRLFRNKGLRNLQWRLLTDFIRQNRRALAQTGADGDMLPEIAQLEEMGTKALRATGAAQWDYVSPNLLSISLDSFFPNMIVGDKSACQWPYLAREIPHRWYVDRRLPSIGFLSRDEAHLLYNNALQFRGRPGLEIGCWMGWSACHLLAAGVLLDVVDPTLDQAAIRQSVVQSTEGVAKFYDLEARPSLHAGASPERVLELATDRRWDLIFIDGNHETPGPLQDAMACEKCAADDAMVLFHDLTAPAVADGLNYFRQRGWQTLIYNTMQIMGVAWRGNVQPVEHQADPQIQRSLPDFLQDYAVSKVSTIEDEYFQELVGEVKSFTVLSEARLYSLYRLAKEICREDWPGNFVECGVYKGGASAMLACVVKRFSQRPRTVYAFDTFAGMPDPSAEDKHNSVPANQTGFGAGTLKAPLQENLQQLCERLEVSQYVQAVQGLFADTLPNTRESIGPIALLHADGDWYESTLCVLRNLYDQLTDQAFVQIDDYGHWEGCRKAVHQFQQERQVLFSLHPVDYTGAWFRKP